MFFLPSLTIYLHNNKMKYLYEAMVFIGLNIYVLKYSNVTKLKGKIQIITNNIKTTN